MDPRQREVPQPFISQDLPGMQCRELTFVRYCGLLPTRSLPTQMSPAWQQPIQAVQVPMKSN